MLKNPFFLSALFFSICFHWRLFVILSSVTEKFSTRITAAEEYINGTVISLDAFMLYYGLLLVVIAFFSILGPVIATLWAVRIKVAQARVKNIAELANQPECYKDKHQKMEAFIEKCLSEQNELSHVLQKALDSSQEPCAAPGKDKE